MVLLDLSHSWGVASPRRRKILFLKRMLSTSYGEERLFEVSALQPAPESDLRIPQSTTDYCFRQRKPASELLSSWGSPSVAGRRAEVWMCGLAVALA